MATLNRDDTSLHATLLSDRTRTHAFLRAIRNVVRPEDVVVEIGTGTALLAMAAIRAGARHVYALEAGPIARALNRFQNCKSTNAVNRIVPPSAISIKHKCTGCGKVIKIPKAMLGKRIRCPGCSTVQIAGR